MAQRRTDLTTSPLQFLHFDEVAEVRGARVTGGRCGVIGGMLCALYWILHKRRLPVPHTGLPLGAVHAPSINVLGTTSHAFLRLHPGAERLIPE